MTRQAVRCMVRLLAAWVALSAVTGARAQLVELAWDASGDFRRAFEIAPKKFAEVCGRLTKGQSVDWSFAGESPLNFNIHYHEGSRVVFPAKNAQTASLEGTLAIAADQDYCWMWENDSPTKRVVTVALRRR